MDAGNVGVAVRRSPGALAFPQHFSQTFHGVVVRAVQRVALVCEQFHRLADAAWLVNGTLLAYRQVHGQMQERVGAPIVAAVHRCDGGIGIAQIAVVLGMLVNPLRRDGLQRFQRLGCTRLGIDCAKVAADVGLGGVEDFTGISVSSSL